jgi:hypothetical protein
MGTSGSGGSPRALRVIAVLVIVAGAVFAIAGLITWFVVQDQLADENITVADDADRFAGEPVDGPFTAYAQANTIERHGLEASDGLTYAELPQDDPRRDTVMTASFLRASLFTSIVAFGVAAFAVAIGAVLIAIGIALLRIQGRLEVPAAAY